MSLEKKALGIGLLWWLFSGSKKKSSTTTSPTAKSSPSTSTPSEPGRPEEAKPKPAKKPVDLTPDQADAAELPKAKKPKAEGEAAKPKADQAAKPKGKAQPISKEQQEDAAEFARGFFKVYSDRGIEEPQAAAEALSLYLLAGGSDPKEIAFWQKKMGVEASGDYNKETSTFIAANLDMAIDSAINGIIQRVFTGENPPAVAGEVLLQYIRDGRDIGTVIPREKLAALQMMMGVQPISGVIDDATKNRLVELGITPTEEE